MNILPGVLATNLKELKEQLSKLTWAKKIHLDIMDGTFVLNKTVQAKTLAKLFPKAQVQVHLMANNPQKYVKTYSKLGATEFIIHAEATEKHADVLEEIRMAGMKSGIAFNPGTKISQYRDALIHADLGLVMTVNPGFSGQKFLKGPLRKIEQIHKTNPLVSVGIDGGFNLKSCRHLAHHDLQFAIASSAVTGSHTPKKSYFELLKASTK